MHSIYSVVAAKNYGKKDADTVTPIIVTNLPGSAPFIQLC